MTAAHLDWMVLGFMQGLAAFMLDRWPTPGDAVAAGLLVYGGWINPLAYVFRALGIDAFSFAGGPGQRLAAFFLGTSSLAITAAWLLLLLLRVAA